MSAFLIVTELQEPRIRVDLELVEHFLRHTIFQPGDEVFLFEDDIFLGKFPQDSLEATLKAFLDAWESATIAYERQIWNPDSKNKRIGPAELAAMGIPALSEYVFAGTPVSGPVTYEVSEREKTLHMSHTRGVTMHMGSDIMRIHMNLCKLYATLIPDYFIKSTSVTIPPSAVAKPLHMTVFEDPQNLFVSNGDGVAIPFDQFHGWTVSITSKKPIRLFDRRTGVTKMMLRDYADIVRFFELRQEAMQHNEQEWNAVMSEFADKVNNIEPIDTIQKAVDPSHYKGYIEDMQWLDAMSQIPTLRKPERFIAAVELQIRKYMDRNGQKDLPLQEFKKANFYMTYLIMYMENDCKPIRAADVHARIVGAK